MTSKTSKTKKNISLILDDEFIQYCKLNEIDDVEKLAKETFKRGFDLLKYGTLSLGKITSQDQEKVGQSKDKPLPPPPPPEIIKKETKVKPPEPKVVEIEEDPIIIEAEPLKSSDGTEVFKKMGVITKKKDRKSDLYDE